MALFKCKMCGGDLDVTAGVTVCECAYCGTQQTVPAVDDEKKVALFSRANRLRMACEFDKAAGIYETIVAEFPEEAEAYWGLILCKYGIEYVDDPTSGKKIPTCHRSSFENVLDDANFELIMENADTLARAVYREEAKQIEALRRGIVEVSSKEAPYDIFICYKETDEHGDRTVDSVIAQDVYTALTEKGYRVFFSRITLEDKLGQEYEPYIFAALNSAKIMLAFGTDYEYYNAVWVKNEWSRFLQLIEKGEKKTLIPCYKEIDAYDMPKEFARLQAQDMGKVGAIQDLLRGIEKILPREVATVKETITVTNSESLTTPLIKRAFMFLEDGNWTKADSICEQALNFDPECAEAYLGKLMAELQVEKQDDLPNYAEPFENSSNYQAILRFGTDLLKETVTSAVEHIKSRNEAAELEARYQAACDAMNTASSENEYRQVSQKFREFIDYKDATALADECLIKAKECHQESILLRAQDWMDEGTVEGYRSAIKILESLQSKKANEIIAICNSRIEELKLAQQEKTKRTKKFIILASTVTTAAVIVITLLITVIVPNIRYNRAVTLLEQGQYRAAYEIFEKLENFKDSVVQMEEARFLKNQNALKNCTIGRYVAFGAYEQGNDKKEDIQWLVLDIQDGKALLISKDALDCQPYHTTKENAVWKTSSLRQWLNSQFANEAFSSREKALISTSTLPDEETQDKIFLLSDTEARQYLGSSRTCKATQYAIVTQGAYTNRVNGTCSWWLRSSGIAEGFITYVREGGTVSEHGSEATSDGIAVRPALWIDLSKLA